MDFDEAVTVTKLYTQDGLCYLLIFWLTNSFDVFIYSKNKLWKGKFSPDRLKNFSKNLQLKEDDYFARVKRCLTEQKDDYSYEFTNGFFYWKRKFQLSVIIEGFLPLDKTTYADPNLVEVLLKINKHLKEKVNVLQSTIKTIKIDYLEHLNDTEDFVNLKEKMEKFVCQKYRKLIYLKKSKVNMIELETIDKIDDQTRESLLNSQENFTITDRPSLIIKTQIGNRN
ncbi:uncharacterized protein [Battus philenor]|uniref:uncharacterized protein n=1 Tax=Battus philenor TaxID=42288 RepID=UPI0035CF1BD6